MKKLFIFFITTLILQCFIPVWGQSYECQCSLLSDKNTVCKNIVTWKFLQIFFRG